MVFRSKTLLVISNRIELLTKYRKYKHMGLSKMKKKHLVFVSDLGHTGPIWPQILDGLASKNWNVTILSPKLSRAQINFFGLNYKGRKWELVQTNLFHSPYRRFAGYPALVRFPLSKLSNMKQKDRIVKNTFLEDYEGWTRIASKELDNLNKKMAIDIIMSSSSPFVTHIIAEEFSKVNHVPWVADFRDLWSLNHSLEEFDLERIIFETKMLKSANFCTTTSLGFRNDLTQLYSGKILVIENGYDKLKNQKNTLSTSPIEILYPGQIYERLQDIRPLIRVLIKINGTEKIKYNLKISGYAISQVQKILADMNHDNLPWIKFGRVLPLEKSLRNQQKSDLLLLLNCTQPNITGWMQTKLYEYISSGVPILALGGQGIDESSSLITDSKSGFVVRNFEEIEDFLTKFYSERRSWLIRDDGLVAQLSRYNQGTKLAESLDEIC